MAFIKDAVIFSQEKVGAVWNYTFALPGEDWFPATYDVSQRFQLVREWREQRVPGRNRQALGFITLFLLDVEFDLTFRAKQSGTNRCHPISSVSHDKLTPTRLENEACGSAKRMRRTADR